MLSLCAGEPGAGFGTTPDIKEIAMGRCYDYITRVHPGLRYQARAKAGPAVLSAALELCGAPSC